MKDFIYGFLYPFKSLKFFFSHPKLITLSIVPMIINLMIYGTIFYFTYSSLTRWLKDLLGIENPNVMIWSWFIYYSLIVITFVVVLLVCYLIFSILGGLVTAPFNEKISQKVEEIVTGKPFESKLTFWQDARVSIFGELQKTAFYFPIIFVLFLMEFIPVIGTFVATPIGFIFSFFYNALDFMDYPLTRRLVPFKEKLRIVSKGGWLTYGFGTMAFLLMFLPVVNVFMKPILVAAGTSLFYERGYDKY